VRINGNKVNNNNFYTLVSLFKSKSGKKISLELVRDQKPIKTSFNLYKMI